MMLDPEKWESEAGHDMGNTVTGRTVCPCGVDHPLADGETGAAKLARWNEPGYWTGVDDPKVEALLDDIYAEAWLGGGDA